MPMTEELNYSPLMQYNYEISKRIMNFGTMLLKKISFYEWKCIMFLLYILKRMLQPAPFFKSSNASYSPFF